MKEYINIHRNNSRTLSFDKQSVSKLSVQSGKNLPIQQKITFNKDADLNQQAVLLDKSDKYKLMKEDDIPRQFQDINELDRYMDEETDFIGVMLKNESRNKWVRFNPEKKYVLGEEHNKIVLSDFTTAVNSKNFQHERFSRIEAIKKQGYQSLADKTREINKERYNLYKVNIDTDDDIDQYALESPMPKIAYCMNRILEEKSFQNSQDDEEKGNGYSLFKTYMTYIELSLSMVEDLLRIQSSQGIKKTCLITTLPYMTVDDNLGRIRTCIDKMKKNESIDKRDKEIMILYLKKFVYDTLEVANDYADKTQDGSSSLVKYKKDNGNDFTNLILPREKPSIGEILSSLRDEEMINHIRENVRYVGMGDAHARRLETRLTTKGFKVIHTSEIRWSDINNFE